MGTVGRYKFTSTRPMDDVVGHEFHVPQMLT
jgi:hypothetical protein